jgi:hypothetical protein
MDFKKLELELKGYYPDISDEDAKIIIQELYEFVVILASDIDLY